MVHFSIKRQPCHRNQKLNRNRDLDRGWGLDLEATASGSCFLSMSAESMNFTGIKFAVDVDLIFC